LRKIRFFVKKPNVPICQTGWSGFWPMHSVTIYSAELSSAKPDGLVSESGGSKNFRNSDETSEMMMVDPDDWRTPLVRYLENPSHIANRKFRRPAFKYVMLDNTLYRRTIYGLLLKCLGSEQSKIAMKEVHECICGTHQSAHKMKWLLRHDRFYWPTMLNDCFRYYKGCELCQRFGNVQLALAAMLHLIIKPWSFHGWTLDFIGQFILLHLKAIILC
jgi:hypothetical protein